MIIGINLFNLKDLNSNFYQITVGFTGIVYLGLLPSYLIRIRFLEEGKILILYLLLISWVGDTGAFLLGTLLELLVFFWLL